jgi:hypothetical protein
MNIFFLDADPVTAAEMQCDKHVPKMIVECAQMLSTAHRVLDGVEYVDSTTNGRRIKRWKHPTYDDLLYKATHVNHPSAIWTRESNKNYYWLFKHFGALASEFTVRFNGKIHASYSLLSNVLKTAPMNIPVTNSITEIRLAINEQNCIVQNDPIKSYRNFYNTKQHRFKMKWSYPSTQPTWFKREGV